MKIVWANIKNLKIYFLLFLIFSIHLNALSMVEVSEEKSISLLEYSDVYFDNKNLTKDELIKNKYLLPYLKSTINNAQSKSTVWINFKLYNASNSTIERSLILTSPSLEFISLYRGDGNFPEKNGISVDASHATIDYSYNITIPAHSSKEYFISAASSLKYSYSSTIS